MGDPDMRKKLIPEWYTGKMMMQFCAQMEPGRCAFQPQHEHPSKQQDVHVEEGHLKEEYQAKHRVTPCSTRPSTGLQSRSFASAKEQCSHHETLGPQVLQSDTSKEQRHLNDTKLRDVYNFFPRDWKLASVFAMTDYTSFRSDCIRCNCEMYEDLTRVDNRDPSEQMLDILSAQIY